MAVMNSEYIDNNVESIVEFIENYPQQRNYNMLHNICKQTNNPVVLEALEKRGITKEVVDVEKN